MTIMHLDYVFEFDNKKIIGHNVDIGETCNIEAEKENIESLKISAICHEFDLQIDDEDEIEEILSKANFLECELID